MSDQFDETKMVDVIKFEMKCVRNNILMSSAEKNKKIAELKTLAPKCSDWDGLDEIIQERKSFFETYKY